MRDTVRRIWSPCAPTNRCSILPRRSGARLFDFERQPCTAFGHRTRRAVYSVFQPDIGGRNRRLGYRHESRVDGAGLLFLPQGRRQPHDHRRADHRSDRHEPAHCGHKVARCFEWINVLRSDRRFDRQYVTDIALPPRRYPGTLRRLSGIWCRHGTEVDIDMEPLIRMGRPLHVIEPRRPESLITAGASRHFSGRIGAVLGSRST